METDISQMTDHDLLITMHEQIKGIKADIKDLKDGTSLKLADHESRLRRLEEKMTKVLTWGAVGLAAIGIIQFIIGKYF